MKITGTVVKLGIVSVVLLFFTVMIIVIFGQMRFDRTNGYTAEFSNVSGLRQGQFVRASGVEIGKVKALHLVDGGRRVRVEFNIDRSVPLYQSTTAQIRYSDLIGNRYVELKRGEGKGANDLLPPGGLIPLSRTSPALDLDALIGGFKPVFRALDPAKVNNIANALITVFQGQGGTINDILDQTAQLTSQIAERDQAIGEVVKNLNIVLDTTVKHRKEFDETVNNLENLITGLRNHSDQLAGGLAHIIKSISFLASTRIMAGLVVIIPLYALAMIMSFLSPQITTTVLYGQSNGTYEHYFQTFLRPDDVFWSFLEALIITAIVMVSHCYYGYAAGGGPVGVGEAVGRSMRFSLVSVQVVVLFAALALYGVDPNFNLTV